MNMRILISYLMLLSVVSCQAQTKLKVLIVDGQNNHQVWPKSTIIMQQYLEETGLFTVDIERTKYTWKADREKEYLSLAKAGVSENFEEPKIDKSFSPNFDKYDVVISNFGWKAAPWSKQTQEDFEKYVEAGGGFVSVHAADNSFPEWEAYNKMIGLGGWGDRNEKDGPYLYYSNEGKLVRDSTVGESGAHGKRHRFPVTVRNDEHPITKGMPKVWLTGIDECYAKLRGPADNLTILATGKDQNENAPTDRHEPVLMTIEYGKGRVFHTTLGHDVDSYENVGFIVSFLRGTEWAASGKVTQEIPTDFPTAEEPKSRTFQLLDE
jgi:type 1 glutamine amidotransferase